ncbi:TPA: DUF2972 domain-containing protein [Campylobacter coli]|nr:DUF2972 domain-containing protein [Campylobacter coli]
MEQILKILKQMLNPDQAQILLKALKNSNNENFYNFALENIEIICEWLNSKEFQENYTNHPYPPLLNPNYIDTDASRHCAELAWDLNLPLPKHYKFIYISPHGVGAAAFLRYLNEACNVFCLASWMLPYDAKERYCINYMCLNDKNISDQAINISELNIINLEKYLALLDPHSKVICGIRDPIGILKHNWGRDWSKVQRNFQNEFDLTYDYRNYINFLNHKKPEIKINLEELNYSVFIINYLSKYFNQEYIYYLDMEKIKTKNAFQTMEDLAFRFGFTPPCLKESENLFKIQEFRGYIRYLFPITLYANQKDLNNIFSIKSPNNNPNASIDTSTSIAIILDRPHKNSQKINIVNEILNNDLSNDMSVYIDKSDLEKLEKNTLFFKQIKNYLYEFLQAIHKTIKHTEDSMMKEEDVLLYFSKNKTLTLEFKEIFNKELKYIKQSHPNIAASWKYYQEFEKICEELDKKE